MLGTDASSEHAISNVDALPAHHRAAQDINEDGHLLCATDDDSIIRIDLLYGSS